MTRHRGQADGEWFGDGIHRRLPLSETRENRPACGICESGQRYRKGVWVLHLTSHAINWTVKYKKPAIVKCGPDAGNAHHRSTSGFEKSLSPRKPWLPASSRGAECRDALAQVSGPHYLIARLGKRLMAPFFRLPRRARFRARQAGDRAGGFGRKIPQKHCKAGTGLSYRAG